MAPPAARRLRHLGAVLRRVPCTEPAAKSVPAQEIEMLPAPQCHAEDLLDMSVVAKFDPEQFARDGLWIWEGVLTPKGQQKMAEVSISTSLQGSCSCPA